ncbi:MAG: chorismate mutase [Magnetospirillum sp.]|nr:chorismate mutase [Magnetospirillum sp.]
MTLPSSLESLRRDIDRIDDQLHDLLLERCALVEKVGEVKANDDVAFHPGREAQILRRLIARHTGSFPKAALIRIWREIIGTLTGVQKPFAVAVTQPERGSGFIEIARDHFGVVAPIFVNINGGQVVKLVAEGQASVGVVPLPGHGPGGAEPWWIALATGREDRPYVVTRLQIFPWEPARARAEPLEALVIARRLPENTGVDRTLVVAETSADVSRDRLRAILVGIGLEPVEMLVAHSVDGTVLHLIEVAGWIAPDDERLSQAPRDPLLRVSVIGGFPLPLMP